MFGAYLLLGEREAQEEYLDEVFAKENISRVSNPDLHYIVPETLTVDEARSINIRAREKAFGSKKVFVLAPERFTPEAQNALLKTLEELPTDTYFFILAREVTHFLPTVLSRVQTIRLAMSKSKPLTEVDEFLKASPNQRIDWAKKFADKNERSALTPFLDSLLLELRDQKKSLDVLKKVLALREFSSDPSTMPRLILEHLALVI